MRVMNNKATHTYNIKHTHSTMENVSISNKVEKKNFFKITQDDRCIVIKGT